jgi:hypothetical protein
MRLYRDFFHFNDRSRDMARGEFGPNHRLDGLGNIGVERLARIEFGEQDHAFIRILFAALSHHETILNHREFRS